MPIESINLDDLRFKDIELLMRSQIQVYAPEWTDHNESDPGITMIQLFSHLGEQLGFRLNQLPEKNYLEFLKMIGVTLKPAEPASTLMNFILASPELIDQFLIPKATKINASSDAQEPPVFETDQNLDVVPAQLAAIVSTRSEVLTQINAPIETGPSDINLDPQVYSDERFSLVWDGKTPKLKDMPMSPIGLFHRPTEATHQYLWLALAFNTSVTAGFLGSRVNLHVQLDDDEQASSFARAQCGESDPELIDLGAPDEDLIEYQYYRPPQLGESVGSWRALNIIGDSTQGWAQTGSIRFDVPSKMGAIPDAEWEEVEAGLPHPIIGALKNPVRGAPEQVPASGWIRVRFKTIASAATIRSISFNVVSATSAVTVNDEHLGRGNGRPGQLITLSNTDVFNDTLELQSVLTEDSKQVLAWHRVTSFDGAGPFDRVYVLDNESATLAFGDKINGVPPADNERMVARAYRHGGGLDTEVAVGMVDQPNGLPGTVDAAINIVAARGGKDAETIDEAKLRAPLEMQAQERAVTIGDFSHYAIQTPGLRVGAAHIVTFHKPYAEGRVVQNTLIPKTGIDFDVHIPGVVSVIVVPDEEGLYPTPTKGSLYKVCQHLDNHRLITTEVYATVAQYVRIFDLDIELRAKAGYTRTQLREAISLHLETYFHVLNGGQDGRGFPFGSTVHHADFVAKVFEVEGVDRVESLSAMFDGHTPQNAAEVMNWREERLIAKRLINCLETSNDVDSVVLFADENIFIDASSVNVRFV